jgi:hypothetical protein
MKNSRFHQAPLETKIDGMNRKNLLLALPLAVYFGLLLDLPYVLQRTVFYAFQSRDLGRALELLNGTPIFYGPEMTGGGNLPGPLYYLLLAPSLWFGATWENAWTEMIVLAAAAGTVAWLYFRAKGLALAALLSSTFFGLAVYTQHFLTIFINPSFQFIFLIPILLLILRAFDPELTLGTRNRSFVAAAALIGLAIQIHYSIFFMIPAMLSLQIFAPRLHLPRVSRKALGAAALVLPMASIPYAAWMLLQQAPGQEWNYVGRVADVIPTLAFLLGAIEKMEVRSMALILGNNLLINICPVLFILAATFLLSGLIARGLPHAPWLKEDENLRRRGWNMAKPLLVCAAFGFLPFSYISVVPIANRYGLAMCVALTFLAAVLQESALTSRLKQYTFNILAAGAALVLLMLLRPGPLAAGYHLGLILAAGMIAVLLTYFRHNPLPAAKICGFLLSALLVLLHREYYRSGELRVQSNNMIRHEHWKMAWTDVYSHTGWSLDELKKRVFFVNAHIDGDPEPMYRTVVKELGPQPHNPGAPDGYFVIVNPPFRENQIYEWLLQAPIPEDLRAGIRRRDIKLGEIGWHGVWTIPYWVNPNSDLPRYFHNWAMYYNSAPNPNVLNAVAPGSAAEVNGRYVFKWNECPDQDRYCDNGALIYVNKSRDGLLDLHVEVVGESLSQNSPWIHPTWTQAWNRPFVEVTCGRTTKSFELASSIGFKREYMDYQPLTTYFVANNSILAPFERRFRFRCEGGLTAVTVGRASSTVDQLRSSLTLPARRITLSL